MASESWTLNSFLHGISVFLFQTQLHIEVCFGPFRDFTLLSKMLLSALSSLCVRKGGVSRKCRTLNKSKSSTWKDSSLGCVNDSNHQLNLFIGRGEQSWMLLLVHMENTEQKENCRWVCSTRRKFNWTV